MNWSTILKRLTASLIGVLTVSGPVLAFDNVSLPIVNGTLGECIFQIQKTTNTSVSLRSIFVFSGVKYAGGFFYNGIKRRGPISPILKSDLVACGLTDVHIVVKDSGNVYRDEDYYGIRFRATDPDDGFSYFYEWAVYGVEATRIINTKVRDVAAAEVARSSNRNVTSGENVTSDGSGDLGVEGLRYSDTVKMMILAGSLLSAIAFLYLLRIGYFFIKGLVYKRRSCRIPAYLIGGSHKFLGYISIAGLDGVRFLPDNQIVGGQIQDLLKSEGFVEFDLEVGKLKEPVFVDGYHKFYSPLYFLEPITKEQLSGLLSTSKRKPEVVANIQHKTTRKKWRLNLEARKARLRSIKKTRKM